MNWVDYETNLKSEPVYSINNNKVKNIVLFGNCHLASIGFFLNHLLNKEYNIHIILSWYCHKIGVEHFDMANINNKITNLVKECDIYIHQKHIKDYGVNATGIEFFVNPKALILMLPNFQLWFDCSTVKEYERSLEILDYNIVNSDFKDFYFLIEHKYIQFFNNLDHPTHYILFLLSKCIYSKIKDENYDSCSLDKYYNSSLRNEFLQISDVIKLPGKIDITEKISNITGIPIDCEYFDYPEYQ
jgi:hypothetical protein